MDVIVDKAKAKNDPEISKEEAPYAGSIQGGMSWNRKYLAVRLVRVTEQNSQGGKISGIQGSTDSWATLLTIVQQWATNTF
ncbi:hypothetical protein MCOR25_004902 [Pyricularia grisea]|nr:hypothetical protein MCOR25_004902 [Pyricularia grisea]